MWAAVREIYAAGSRAQVLERLAKWSAPSRHWLRDDAAKCLQGLSRFRGERAVTAFLKEPGPREHLLLLSRRTLLSTGRTHRQCGWNCMRLWVERAGDETGLGELVAEFFAELPEPGVEGDRLGERMLLPLRLRGHQLPNGDTAVHVSRTGRPPPARPGRLAGRSAGADCRVGGPALLWRGRAPPELGPLVEAHRIAVTCALAELRVRRTELISRIAASPFH
ncbi:hypothetical protein [Streptomyces brevispora]|uniref:hypothetical protein n=1 Tax=Streptomyces brevispora TaxID=887462 RepID=UPI0035DBB6C4